MSDPDDSKNDDVLANEVSGSLEVSGVPNLPIEVKGKARSRLISAFDRLLGNIIDLPNPFLEAITAKKRAKTAKEIEAIKQGERVKESGVIRQEEAAIAQGIADPFVRHAVQQFVVEAVSNQDKRILLLQETVEELKRNPSNAEEAASGAEQLDEGFLNRLNKRTEEATPDEIREKWSKVLAGEIRKPGTFSPKVLRIVDEVEPEVAKLFSELCEHRMGDAVPKCLVRKLEFSEQASLGGSGLLVDSGMGAAQSFGSGSQWQKGSEIEVWILQVGDLALSLPKDEHRVANFSDIISFSSRDTDAPSIAAYALTKAGEWLAYIFEDKQAKAFHAYLRKLSEALSEIEVTEWHETGVQGDEKIASLVRVWKAGKPVREA